MHFLTENVVDIFQVKTLRVLSIWKSVQIIIKLCNEIGAV